MVDVGKLSQECLVTLIISHGVDTPAGLSLAQCQACRHPAHRRHWKQDPHFWLVGACSEMVIICPPFRLCHCKIPLAAAVVLEETGAGEPRSTMTLLGPCWHPLPLSTALTTAQPWPCPHPPPGWWFSRLACAPLHSCCRLSQMLSSMSRIVLNLLKRSCTETLAGRSSNFWSRPSDWAPSTRSGPRLLRQTFPPWTRVCSGSSSLFVLNHNRQKRYLVGHTRICGGSST